MEDKTVGMAILVVSVLALGFVFYVNTINAFVFSTGILMYLTGVFNDGGYSQLAALHSTVANYQFPVLAIAYVLLAINFLQDKKLRWLVIPIAVFGGLSLYFA